MGREDGNPGLQTVYCNPRILHLFGCAQGRVIEVSTHHTPVLV